MRKQYSVRYERGFWGQSRAMFGLAALFLAGSGSSLAAVIGWTAQENSSLWNAASSGGGGTTNNWSSSSLPGASDDVVFRDAILINTIRTINLNGNRSMQSLVMDGPETYMLDTSIGVNTLTIGAGNSTNSNSIDVFTDDDQIVNSNVVMADPEPNNRFEIAARGGKLIINGVVSGGNILYLEDAGFAGGTLELSNSNTYTGGTTVASDTTLRVSNSSGSATGSGAVTIENDGTLEGTGRITGAITVETGGIVSPGNSVGTLTAPGGVTLNGTYLCEVNGSGADRLTVSGTLDVSSGTLEMSTLALSPGGSLTIASATQVVGTFPNVIGLGYSVSYTSNTITVERGPAIFVDATAPNGGDGASWATALNDLEDALGAVVAGEEIWVKAGTYMPGSGSLDRDSTFTLPGGISVLGGFAGTETNSNQRDPLLNVTVLSGDLDNNDDNKVDGLTPTPGDIQANNAYSVVSIAFTNPVLDGFTISGGYADGATNDGQGARGRGGAIFIDTNTSATPTIRNCRMIGNFAAQGGAVFIHSFGSSDFIACDFRSNEASGRGGAGYYWRSFITTANCSFSGNYAADDGGAIYDDPLEFGESTYVNCTFNGNRAGDNGGAIAASIQAANPNASSMSNTLIWNNESDTPGQPNDSVSNTSRYTLSHCLLEHIDLSGVGTGNLNGMLSGNDPLFFVPVEPADAPTNEGYGRLRVGSPVLDAGDQTLVSELGDLEGEVRTAGADTDLGAYEQGRAMVLNTNDSGAGSLREAIDTVGAGGRVTFDVSLDGTTISTSSVLAITEGKIIDGSGLETPVVIDAEGSGRVFLIDDPRVETALVFLNDLGITGGNGDGVRGGGIYALEDLVLDRCRIFENAAGSGAGLFLNGISATINDCSFLGNDGGTGGGMALGFASAEVFNSIYAGNSGSAIINGFDGILSMTNCTIAGNEASDFGSGGGIENFGELETNLINCIIWDASPTAIAGSTFNPGLRINNLIEGEAGASDPLFVADPDAGDGDWTTSGDNFYGDLRLTSQSPAVDAGDDGLGASLNDTSFDILGNDRFVGIIDQGAIEYFDPYDDWIEMFYPGETNPMIVGEGADPSGNGLSNLLSFITNTSPMASTAMPVNMVLGETEASFSFARRDDAAVRGSMLEYSIDLVDFDPALDGMDGFEVVVEDDFYGRSVDGVGIDKVTISTSLTGLPKLFGRLVVPGS